MVLQLKFTYPTFSLIINIERDGVVHHRKKPTQAENINQIEPQMNQLKEILLNSITQNHEMLKLAFDLSNEDLQANSLNLYFKIIYQLMLLPEDYFY